MSTRITFIAFAATSLIALGAAAQEKEQPKAAQSPPTVGERLSTAVKSITGSPMAKADTDMARVLEAFSGLNPKPIEMLSAEEARKQPTPADGVKALLTKEGKSTAPEPGVATADVQFDGAAGKLPARIYKPEGATGALPVILYFHGGGFVIADLDTYDASPRAMARLTNALVISAHYRQAPENKFPAAHDDAVAAYKWVIANAAANGGDPQRIVVMGESAGGNLAINVSMAAREQKLQMPTHQVLIYPLAGVDMATPSYEQNATAQPLNREMMSWFVGKYLGSAADKESPMIDVVGRANLAGLPPTTIVTAEIDPLRSEGQALAGKLKAAGGNIDQRDYAGATHEFFGMSAAVKDAADAQSYVAQRLIEAFGKRAQN